MSSEALAYPGPGVYYIKSVATGTVVDLTKGDLTARASNLSVSPPIDAQTWQFASVSSTQVIILNSITGEYIKAPAKPATSRAAIPATGSPLDPLNRYEVQIQSDKSVIIRSAADKNKVLDLSRGNSADGTNILIYPHHGKSNQRWILVPVPQ